MEDDIRNETKDDGGRRQRSKHTAEGFERVHANRDGDAPNDAPENPVPQRVDPGPDERIEIRPEQSRDRRSETVLWPSELRRNPVMQALQNKRTGIPKQSASDTPKTRRALGCRVAGDQFVPAIVDLPAFNRRVSENRFRR